MQYSPRVSLFQPLYNARFADFDIIHFNSSYDAPYWRQKKWPHSPQIVLHFIGRHASCLTGSKSKRRNTGIVYDRENGKIRYRAYEEYLTHPQLGRYRCFSILCETFSPDHGWQLQQSISDVTDSARAAADLAALMQRGSLEPCHFAEVVEDYINSL